MATLNNERKNKLFYRAYFAVAGIFLVFFAWGLVKEIINRQQINKQIADYEEKIAKLQQENSKIKDKLVAWKESGDLEITARTKLGLQKPGEKAIFINREGSEDNESRIAVKTNQEVVDFGIEEKNKEQIANPIKWWRRFFK